MHHMRHCLSQLEAPRSVLRLFFTVIKHMVRRYYDCTEDYKTKLLEFDQSTMRLVKPVVIRECIEISSSIGPKFDTTDGVTKPWRTVKRYADFKMYQCPFCKKLYKTFQYFWEHMGKCEVRLNDHRKRPRGPNVTQPWVYTPLGEWYEEQKREMALSPEKYNICIKGVVNGALSYWQLAGRQGFEARSTSAEPTAYAQYLTWMRRPKESISNKEGDKESRESRVVQGVHDLWCDCQDCLIKRQEQDEREKAAYYNWKAMYKNSFVGVKKLR